MLLKVIKKEMLNVFFIIFFITCICVDAYSGTIFDTPISWVLTISSVLIIIVDSYVISKTYKNFKTAEKKV